MSSYTLTQTWRRMTLRRIGKWVIPGMLNAHRTRIRRCHCCKRISVILNFDATGEARRCIRCGANLRYELLAEYLRGRGDGLHKLDILELDPNSPLRTLLAGGKSHCRTFFSARQPRGSIGSDNTRCEDVTLACL